MLPEVTQLQAVPSINYIPMIYNIYDELWKNMKIYSIILPDIKNICMIVFLLVSILAYERFIRERFSLLPFLKIHH